MTNKETRLMVARTLRSAMLAEIIDRRALTLLLTQLARNYAAVDTKAQFDLGEFAFVGGLGKSHAEARGIVGKTLPELESTLATANRQTGA
ncbi:MAG TPA: hypothetical protein VG476_02505 [Acidimicrobiales bacterium]|nr:hypothetical protein [Acidimicrobiales bacterium]